MRPSKARYITSCQQLLALGAVIAVLTPAASVISLDVVGTPAPQAQPPAPPERATDLQAPGRDRSDAGAPPSTPAPAPRPAPAVVPAAEVEPTVTEVPLTEPEPARETTEEPQRREGRDRTDSREPAPRSPAQPPAATGGSVTSEPQPVEGYGAVGVTWSSEETVDDDEIRFQVRTSTDGEWSGWADLEYHDEHAADPAEGADARPGTDPLLVGTVDLVQARAIADDELPADLSLAVVDPGDPAEVVEEAPELALGEADGAAAADGAAGEAADPEALELQAAATAPQPTIFSRSQWGANERLRDGRPRYGSVSAGFVHHTVNANNYSRADVPGMMRSIYAYHTQSRGWSDIGYNFLVDRFGRIWEGRAGGIARPVIGAHTLGYNEDSFAMSAIGNFDTVRPSDAMLRAYGALFAWKLGLHGINPMDKSQSVNGRTFAAINGHRDAGSTACPGRYLYARLEAIRTYARDAGVSPEPPEPPAPEEPPTPAVVLGQVDSNLAGTPYPDLVVRRRSDGRGMILPTGGLSWFLRPEVLASRWARGTTLAVPDLTGDGRVDVVTRDRAGGLQIRPLTDSGVGAPVRTVRMFRGHGLLASAGDLNGDGRPDFVAGRKRGLVSFLGTPRGTYRRVPGRTGLRGVRQLVGAGDVSGDGHPDLWARDRRGRLLLFPGLGKGTFAARRAVAGSWSGYDWLVGGVDYTADGVPDLVARRRGGSLLLFPSRGDGTLGRAVGPVHGGGLSMISGAGQVTGADAPDLVATRSDGSLVVVPNRGTFELGRPLDTGQSFRRVNLLLNAGDFSGDGHGDVIVRRRAGSVWLYRGDGTGRLATPVRLGGKRQFRKVTGLRVVQDITDDGTHDLVGRVGTAWRVWPGKGAARLGRASQIKPAAPAPPAARPGYDWVVPISDLQRRGPADLIARDRAGDLYRLNGARRGYRAPRYLGEATAYDLGG